MQDFSKVDLSKLQDSLDIVFVPPALLRRSEETGITPEQYIMQAFFKGKMYDLVYTTSKQLDDKLFLELDFVLRVNTEANRLLASLEDEEGQINFADAWEKWVPVFKKLVKEELAERKAAG